MVAMDVFGVEWTKTGAMHMGLTVAYYGFMSDGNFLPQVPNSSTQRSIQWHLPPLLPFIHLKHL